jgi:hypothetical protein
VKKADFDHSVRAGFMVVVDLGLSSWDRQICLRSMTPPEEYRKIIFSAEADYEEIFKAGLRYRAYNFLLEDYSYFQFWHDSKYHHRTVRYAYCPNPFELIRLEDKFSEKSAIYSGSDIHEAFQQALEEASLKIGRPPIRYDLALDDHIEVEHPAAHLTVGGHTENRWPVSRVLTPKLFVLFICKHYYDDRWSTLKGKELSEDGFHNPFDQAMANEKRASRPLEDKKFTDKERLHLFIE